MPPFLPVMSISRSQRIRIGKGPGNQVPHRLNAGDTPYSPQTGKLIGPLYADLGIGDVRKDIEHHSAVGALIHVGAPSNTNYSDLFSASGSAIAVTAGSGFALSVAAGIIQSRYSGAELYFPAATLTPAAPPLFGTRNDLVVVDDGGVVSILTGPADVVAPTFGVLTLTPSASLTGGAYKLGFNFGDYWFTTASTAYNATAATHATNVLAATGGPNNIALSAYVPGATLTGAGGLLSAGTPITLTAGGALEGSLNNAQVLVSTLTGGTLTPSITTPASGVSGFSPNGKYLILATVAVPSTATSSSNYTISTAIQLTS